MGLIFEHDKGQAVKNGNGTDDGRKQHGQAFNGLAGGIGQIAGEQIDSEMLVLAGGHHGAGQADPEHQDTDQHITPDQAGTQQVAQSDLHEGNPHGRGKKHRQEDVFDPVQ